MLGLDALGIGLGGGFGGFGGAFDGNLIGDAVTIFADLKEQQMAQVCSTASARPPLRCASHTCACHVPEPPPNSLGSIDSSWRGLQAACSRAAAIQRSARAAALLAADHVMQAMSRLKLSFGALDSPAS